MKNKIILLSILLLAYSQAFCAKPKEPEWLHNYRTVYPDSEYIVQRGRADTEETAKTEALAQIARYFKTSVNARLKTSVQSVATNGSVDESTFVVNDVDVISQVELFAVEYTDPYYVKKEKKWYCAAFINREKAWIQYRPAVEGAKSDFYAMKKNAEREADPFSKAAACGAALRSGKRFLEKLEYARILNAQKEAEYAPDRESVHEVPSRITAEKAKCSLYLNVKGDYGNIISSALTKTFSENGLNAAKSAGAANYNADVVVENNALGDDPISVYPSLEIKITTKDGKTVYSHQTKVSAKTVAYTIENAQKKSYPILAEQSEKAVSQELSELFGN